MAAPVATLAEVAQGKGRLERAAERSDGGLAAVNTASDAVIVGGVAVKSGCGVAGHGVLLAGYIYVLIDQHTRAKVFLKKESAHNENPEHHAHTDTRQEHASTQGARSGGLLQPGALGLEQDPVNRTSKPSGGLLVCVRVAVVGDDGEELAQAALDADRIQGAPTRDPASQMRGGGQCVPPRGASDLPRA